MELVLSLFDTNSSSGWKNMGRILCMMRNIQAGKEELEVGPLVSRTVRGRWWGCWRLKIGESDSKERALLKGIGGRRISWSRIKELVLKQHKELQEIAEERKERVVLKQRKEEEKMLSRPAGPLPGTS